MQASGNPLISWKKNQPLLSKQDVLLYNKGELQVEPADTAWLEFIASKWWATNYSGNKEVLSPWQKTLLLIRDELLQVGGWQVCLPPIDEDLPLYLMHGEFWLPKGGKRIGGKPCSCHDNSLAYWDSRRDTTSVATGYALSDDGCWRQHSWVVRHDNAGGRVLETTEPRILYYGVTLTEEEAEERM